MNSSVQSTSDKMISLGNQAQSELYYLNIFDNLQKVQSVNSDLEYIKLEDTSGTGKVAIHHVFPGIDLTFNEIHMRYENVRKYFSENTIEINYCLQGCFECCGDNKKYCYAKEGNLAIFSQVYKSTERFLPSKNYHGISILIHLDKIPMELHQVLKIFHVNLHSLNEKLCKAKRCYIIQENKSLKHVFSEIQATKDNLNNGLLKVKVLEILLMLGSYNFHEKDHAKSYLTSNQADTVKQIHDFIIEHVDQHYTLEQLSEQFNISLTLMKKCFKEVYGDSIYAYLKRYRLQIAKKMLDNMELSVADIALQIGYHNANKFTCAFRDAYGMTPSEYRRNK